MNFSDWMDSLEDDEAYDLELIDAWKAGATAMVEHLFNFSVVDEDAQKKLIEEEVDKLAEGRNNE